MLCDMLTCHRRPWVTPRASKQASKQAAGPHALAHRARNRLQEAEDENARACRAGTGLKAMPPVPVAWAE
eukprot:364863-Chlamydomonas_euryale.AAC.6